MSLESDGGMILTGENRRTRRKLACSLGHVRPFTLHHCRWANRPHRVLKRFIETKVPPGTPDAVTTQTGTGKKKKIHQGGMAEISKPTVLQVCYFRAQISA
jgi:hypothetical protein